MNCKLKICLLASLILLNMLIYPAYGIQVSTSTGNANGAVTSSGSYEFSDAASLNVKTILDNGFLYQERRAEGPGENRLKESVFGSQYSIENAVASSGQMSSSSTTVASSEAGLVGTSTDISGESGSIGVISNSDENAYIVAGGFSGKGDLQAELTTVASDSTATIGKASVLGLECYNPEIANMIDSGENGVNVDGIYEIPDGTLGNFGMVAFNIQKSDKYTPETKSTGGNTASDPNAREYTLTQWKLTGPVGIQIATGNMPAGADGEIAAATSIWENSVGYDFFKGTQTVTGVVPDVPKGKNGGANLNDGKNLHGWTDDPEIITDPRIIAVTWTRWGARIPGTNYYSMAESDCYYNSKFSWGKASSDGGSPSNAQIDIRSIALHELGHTLGLGDLYYSAASDEVMYGYYKGVSDWSPNTGDKNGLKAKYGLR